MVATLQIFNRGSHAQKTLLRAMLTEALDGIVWSRRINIALVPQEIAGCGAHGEAKKEGVERVDRTSGGGCVLSILFNVG